LHNPDCCYQQAFDFGGTEALKIIAKETAMSIKDAGAFVNDLVRGRGFGNVRSPRLI
jgi:hypothetical protein